MGVGEEDSAGELYLEEGEDPFAWPEAVSVSIEDVYEIPIKKLSETLNDYRRGPATRRFPGRPAVALPRGGAKVPASGRGAPRACKNGLGGSSSRS